MRFRRRGGFRRTRRSFGRRGRGRARFGRRGRGSRLLKIGYRM